MSYSFIFEMSDRDGENIHLHCKMPGFEFYLLLRNGAGLYRYRADIRFRKKQTIA